MRVLRASFLPADFSLGVSRMPLFSHGSDILTCGQKDRHFSDGAALGGEGRESRCGLCTGASQVPPSVFRGAEAVAHGNAQGPRRAAVASAVAPHRRRRERCALRFSMHSLKSSPQFAVPLLSASEAADPSLFTTSMAPSAQNVRLAGQGRAEQGRVEGIRAPHTVVIPDVITFF